MKTKIFTLILFFILSISFLTGTAQNPDIKRTMHWYFGWGAGLDFSSGVAVPDTTGKSAGIEACFTMSDTCGNLLFYGAQDSTEMNLIIWTNEHTIMQNGIITNRLNPSQVVCIPQPGNDSIYYIFYTDWGALVNGKFLYGIIDSKANNGLGSVIIKDEVLINWSATEHIAATKHCNGIDYWIASKTREWPDGRNIYAWLITSSGLNAVPVTSQVSTVWEENGEGYFKFSPDGSKAAIPYRSQATLYMEDSSYVELYEFDNCTGIFSNPVTLRFPGPYGISFSPDNSKLYVGDAIGDVTSGQLSTGYINQYDLTYYNQDSVESSKVIIKEGPVENHFQIGIDGKIYVNDLDTLSPDYGLFRLGVIHNPNEKGNGCNYIPDEIDMLGRFLWIGLPSYPESFFSSLSYINCDASSSNNQISDSHYSVFPNPFVDEIIVYNNEEPSQFFVEIHDLLGNTLYSDFTNNGMSLNLSGLKSGIYILKVLNQKKQNITNQKIIKL